MTKRALTPALVLLSMALVLTIGAPTAATSQNDGGNSWQHRWVLFHNPQLHEYGELRRLKGIITDAANAGFNGVVFPWQNIADWWKDGAWGQLQHDSLLTVREHGWRLGAAPARLPVDCP